MNTKVLGTHRTRITVIDRKGEAGKHGDDDTTFPWGSFSVGSDRPMDDRIADPVLHLDISHNRTGNPTRKISKS